MVVRWSRVNPREGAAMASDRPFLDAGGVDRPAADLEKDPGQRSRRRSGNRTARAELEQALVTRATDDARLWIGDDRAGKMRALLPVRQEATVLLPHEEAGVVLAGVG